MVLINFYSIVSNNSDKVYVGSTKKSIAERLNQHEKDYKQFQDGKARKCMSYDILELQDYSIQLIETKDCKDRTERDTIECYHIINTPNTVNKMMPGRTKEQYYQDHKDWFIEYSKQYYQDNKLRCLENATQYRQENKEYYSEYNKQYYQENTEQILNKKRQYRQDNKERLKQHTDEKFNCPCGGRYVRKSKTRHFKTQKHLSNI